MFTIFVIRNRQILVAFNKLSAYRDNSLSMPLSLFLIKLILIPSESMYETAARTAELCLPEQLKRSEGSKASSRKRNDGGEDPSLLFNCSG